MRNYFTKKTKEVVKTMYLWKKRYYNSIYCSDKGVNGTIVNLACMGGLNFVLEKINVFCKKYLRCICAC